MLSAREREAERLKDQQRERERAVRADVEGVESDDEREPAARNMLRDR